MNAPQPIKSDKIGAGRAALVNKYEKKFKRGTLIFIEGESSTEMYIIKSGKIRILKQEGETTIELAILGPGSVMGELALLDHQPRSATAQVIEETTSTIIDEELLHQTMEKIPSWLANIIQVVVKRLRDTMKRTSDDIVRKSVSGVIRVVLLMLSSGKQTLVDNCPILLLNKVKETVYSTIGLGGIETENVFLHLILKDMLYIRKNDMGEEFLLIRDSDILQLYMNYLRSHQHDTPLLGENLSDQAIDLARIISEAGDKNGKKIQEKIIMIGIPQIELELQRNKMGIRLDPNLLDELINAKVMGSEQAGPQAATAKRTMVVYNKETVRRAVQLHKWLKIFKEDVKF
jgi:CRP-like cAMP-binding protein